MKKKNIISVIVLLLLLAFAIYYFNKNFQDFKDLSIENPLLIIPIVVVLLLSFYNLGQQNKELLKPFNVLLGYGEAFSLAVVTRFYNLITPFRGGMAARAVYLKKKHNFAYVHFLATLSAIYVLVFLVASFLGILSALAIYYQTGVLSWIILSIFLAVFLGMLFVIFVSPKFEERKNKWLNRIVKVVNGWHLIKGNKRVVMITLGITFVQILLSTLMLWLQFRVFGIEVGLASCLFLSSIANLGILIGITPGNLGINEAVIVFSAMTIGITPAESLSVALLGRAVSLVVLFILGPIFSWVLMRNGK